MEIEGKEIVILEPEGFKALQVTVTFQRESEKAKEEKPRVTERIVRPQTRVTKKGRTIGAGHRFTPEQKQYVLENYGKTVTGVIAEKLSSTPDRFRLLYWRLKHPREGKRGKTIKPLMKEPLSISPETPNSFE